MLLPAAPFLLGDLLMAALITLDDYKLYKKLTKTDSDQELGFIIKSVSNLIKTYCGHSIIDYYTVAKEEYFNVSPGQHALLLNEWPVKEVGLVESFDSTTNTFVTVDASAYYVDTSIDTLFIRSGEWPSGFGSIKVTYTAGYSTTPDDIKIAALDLVAHYFKEEYKEKKTLGSASIDNSQTRVGTSKWPAHVVRVLDMYKNA